jgi:hypothetical protein
MCDLAWCDFWAGCERLWLKVVLNRSEYLDKLAHHATKITYDHMIISISLLLRRYHIYTGHVIAFDRLQFRNLDSLLHQQLKTLI